MAVSSTDYRSAGSVVETGSERVTWLLPVKNGMPYLSETLASIAAQTYVNWEVIAWDNGSTDGSVEELRRWIPDRLPGKLIADRPLPLAASLAEMVRMADTELCARIDADDINHPERLEQQVAFLRERPDVVLVGTWVERIDDRSIKHGLYSPFPKDHRGIVIRFLHANAIFHPTVLFRRSAILCAGNYQEVGPAEDYELWLRMAATGLKLANIDVPLVHYRVHDRGASSIQHAEGRLLPASDEHVGRYARALYGCSADDVQLLRHRSHPHAAKILRQIGGHLGDTRSADFSEAARAVIAPADIKSRLTIAALSPNRLAILAEIGSITRDAARKVARRIGGVKSANREPHGLGRFTAKEHAP